MADEFEALSTQTPNRLNIISGTDNNMLAALRHGNGVILGSGNVYTKLVANIFAAHRALSDDNRRHLAAGATADARYPDAVRATRQAFALLRHGLAEHYG